MNSTKLLAIGVTNAAAILSDDNKFQQLTPQQRNSIRVVAYGSEAGEIGIDYTFYVL